MTRKRGVYYYRRRLPHPHKGELALSLLTRHFREAEHLAAPLDLTFSNVTKRMSDSPNQRAILRDHLKQQLDDDLEQHLSVPPGRSVYALHVEEHQDPVDADLDVIDDLLSTAKEARARRDYAAVDKALNELTARYQVPEEKHSELATGLLQANVQSLEKARERLLEGVADPIVLEDGKSAGGVTVSGEHQAVLEVSGPKLSELLPDFIEFMVTEEGWRGQTEAQNRKTYSMFMEFCGDRPLQSYQTSDTRRLYDLLRKLPAQYSKAAEWRGMSLADIVAQTKDQELERLTMKTVKRHFSALGKLFAYYKKRGEYEGDNTAYGFEFPTKGRQCDKR